VAWNLVHQGADVLLFDSGQPGAEVTNWSFSWVNASNKTQTRKYFDLNVAGMSAHDDLVADLRVSDWCHLTGHLRWFETPELVGHLRADVDLLQSWGYATTIWRADQVRRLLEPEVRFPAEDTEVAIYPNEGWVEGRALVALLIEDAARHGLRVYPGAPVTDIAVKRGRVAEVVHSGGDRVAVDAVVNACGPFAWQIAELVGRELPMRDEPGLVVRLRCEVVPVRRAMHAPHVEIRPDGGNQVVLHSREVDARIDPWAGTDDLAAHLRALGADAVPALDGAKLVSQKVAWRPIPGDGFPSVGGIQELPGYYEAVTHSGITLGPIVGRLLAHEIIDGTIDPLVSAYRPDRYART
jgi:glycine/D-amino acid oxidase-like deaminating enzyme